MNKEQIAKRKATTLFKKYNLEGSITQLFVCRYFDTKDINDLRVLERAKLDLSLKIELTNLLRSYFNSFKNKNLNLTEDNITNLLLQIDQYEMVGKFIDLSLDEIIKKYKDEFIQSEYNDYYEFLSDTLENIFYNLNMKI